MTVTTYTSTFDGAMSLFDFSVFDLTIDFNSRAGVMPVDDGWLIYVVTSGGSSQQFRKHARIWIKKENNELSQFDVTFDDIQTADKTYIVEGSKIYIYRYGKLKIKGIIRNVKYTSAYSAIITGQDMGVLLADKMFQDPSSPRTYVKEWENTNSDTIIKEWVSGV